MGFLAYLVFTGYPVLRAVLTLAVVVGCVVWPRGWGKWKALEWMGRRWVGGLVVFGVVGGVTGAMAAKRGLPRAYVHDEFSYLLAADTFAHGRLTNPTPAGWEHFEAEHVLVRPSYQSKYPPGQGMVMAVGQVLFGHPIWGVWISGGLAAAGVWWALRAIVPGGWAMLGGFLTGIHPQMLEWGQRYWGGYVGVIGGAMVVGGVLRMMKDGGWGAWVAAGVGMVVLGNSRPFEGLVLSVLMGGWFLVKRMGGRPMPRKGVVAMVAVLGLGGAWMGYYNWRVTGSVVRLPYVEHQRQYGGAPLFAFQRMGERPEKKNRELDQFANDQMWTFTEKRTKNWHVVADSSVAYLFGLVLSGFGNVEALAIPLLILPWLVVRERRLRGLVIVLGVFGLVLLVETYMYGHYAAPAAVLCAAVVIVCMRWLNRMGRPIGRVLVRVSVALAVVWSLFWWVGFWGWEQEKDSWMVRKAAVERSLLNRPGKHLVIVWYSPAHNVHDEWVYNGADLQGARVIWARGLGDECDNDLATAYRGRSLWLLRPDDPDPRPVVFQKPPE